VFYLSVGPRSGGNRSVPLATAQHTHEIFSYILKVVFALLKSAGISDDHDAASSPSASAASSASAAAASSAATNAL